jgi:hypothetical protein
MFFSPIYSHKEERADAWGAKRVIILGMPCFQGVIWHKALALFFCPLFYVILVRYHMKTNGKKTRRGCFEILISTLYTICRGKFPLDNVPRFIKAFMSCVQKAKMTNVKKWTKSQNQSIKFCTNSKTKTKKNSTSSNAQIIFYNLLMTRINTYQYNIV